MATHDYVIANGTGAAVRSDLNGALAAIVSQNSSATEPSPSYAYQRWADTTAGVMKMRNGANNAWITLYQLDGEWSTIAFENGTAAAPSIYFKDSGTDTGIYSPGADQVGISTGGTARITVDGSGNVNIDSNTLYVDAVNNRVGIGTSGPEKKLHVVDTSDGATTTPLLVMNRGNATSTAAQIALIATGSDFSDGQYAAIKAISGGTGSTANNLAFLTCTSGGTPTERLYITSSGRLDAWGGSAINSFNLVTPSAAGTTYYLIYGAHSSSGAGNYGTQSFGVWSNGNVVNTNNSYGAISDIKLKENIVDANSQWNDLKALQVRNFNFKEGQTHTQIGLVAQEVEEVSPGLVSQSPDRDAEGNDLGTVTKSVNYSVLYMKAVKALQEAMERIEQLEAEMAAVKSQLS